MEKNSYKMLGILQSYAPNSAEQQGLAGTYSEMQADGMTEDQMVAVFAGAILDGLLDGNWPWVITKRSN